LNIEKSRRQAGNIRIDDGNRLIERETRDGIRRVATNPGKRLKWGHVSRASSPVFCQNGLGRGVQIARASVVTKPLPGVQNIALRSASQRVKIRKAPEPSIVIGQNAGNLSLLKHEFGNENCIRVPRVTPGQIAAMAVVPAKQGRTKALLVLKCIQSKQTSNSLP